MPPHFPDLPYVALDALLHYEVGKDNPEQFWRKFSKVLPSGKTRRRWMKDDVGRTCILLVAHDLIKRAEA